MKVKYRSENVEGREVYIVTISEGKYKFNVKKHSGTALLAEEVEKKFKQCLYSEERDVDQIDVYFEQDQLLQLNEILEYMYKELKIAVKKEKQLEEIIIKFKNKVEENMVL